MTTLTKLEARLLVVLNKRGGTAMRSELSQATARFLGRDREHALARLEEWGLIGSARVPTATRTGLTYWLTDAGREQLEADGAVNTGL